MTGERTHKELFDSMALPTAKRPAIISKELKDMLKEYLGFRHFFRHAYVENLEWNRLEPLFMNMSVVWIKFKNEILNKYEIIEKK